MTRRVLHVSVGVLRGLSLGAVSAHPDTSYGTHAVSQASEWKKGKMRIAMPQQRGHGPPWTHGHFPMLGRLR